MADRGQIDGIETLGDETLGDAAEWCDALQLSKTTTVAIPAVPVAGSRTSPQFLKLGLSDAERDDLSELVKARGIRR